MIYLLKRNSPGSGSRPKHFGTEMKLAIHGDAYNRKNIKKFINRNETLLIKIGVGQQNNFHNNNKLNNTNPNKKPDTIKIWQNI